MANDKRKREEMSIFERIEIMTRARGIIRGVTAELNDHGLGSGAIALGEADTYILGEVKELKLEAFGGGPERLLVPLRQDGCDKAAEARVETREDEPDGTKPE